MCIEQYHSILWQTNFFKTIFEKKSDSSVNEPLLLDDSNCLKPKFRKYPSNFTSNYLIYFGVIDWIKFL